MHSLTTAQAEKAIPKIGPGMNQKVLAAVEAVEMGAMKSVISSGLKENPLQNALSDNGTVISK